VKAHLRIDPNWIADDATLSAFLQAATEYVERETRTQILMRNFLLTLDGFPTDRFITLPRPPLSGVASVNYTDANGNAATLPTSAYTVDATTMPGRIVLNPGIAWPDTPPQQANAVRIAFSAGYSGIVSNPMLEQCIKFLVGHYYENREGAIDRRIDTIPLAVESIIQSHAYPEVRG
jgi:uncharacterized phiE125 gp8 family phage protein